MGGFEPVTMTGVQIPTLLNAVSVSLLAQGGGSSIEFQCRLFFGGVDFT